MLLNLASVSGVVMIAKRCDADDLVRVAGLKIKADQKSSQRVPVLFTCINLMSYVYTGAEVCDSQDNGCFSEF